MKIYSRFLFVIFLIVSRTGYSQLIPSKPNQVDQNGIKQGEWIYLFDENWNLTEDRELGEAYQMITYKDGKPVGRVAEYSLNGELLVEYDSLVSEDPLIYEGMKKVYSEEGNLVSLGHFQNGKMDTTFVTHKFKQLIDTYSQEIPNHSDLAYTANNLAYLYLAQERYDSAEIYYRTSQEIREKALGINDVVYANSCNKLAYVLVQQGKLIEAEPLYKTSMRVHGQVLGTDSDYYVGARSNLAYIYMITKRFKLAETLYLEAAEWRLNDYGKDDKHYKYYNFQLARVYAKLNDWQKALNAYLLSKELTGTSKVDLLWFVELMKE